MKNTKTNWIIGAVALLVLPLILQSFGNAWVRIADLALLYVLLALGLNIVVGYAGLLDLGYVAFYAVGAYLFGLMASPHLADNFAALAWLAGNAAGLGVDPARIAIAGESAGGGHAAMLAQHAQARGGPALCLQVLDAPMLDDRTGTTADPHPYTGEFVWTAEKNRFGWTALLGVAAGGGDVPAQAVPARASDLAGQPAAYIAVGALDLFLEENLEYARRLTRAGVPVELHVTPGSYHGAGIMAAAPQNRQALEWKLAAYRRAFGS